MLVPECEGRPVEELRECVSESDFVFQLLKRGEGRELTVARTREGGAAMRVVEVTIVIFLRVWRDTRAVGW